jgi:hypothetical protein
MTAFFQELATVAKKHPLLAFIFIALILLLPQNIYSAIHPPTSEQIKASDERAAAAFAKQTEDRNAAKAKLEFEKETCRLKPICKNTETFAKNALLLEISITASKLKWAMTTFR